MQNSLSLIVSDVEKNEYYSFLLKHGKERVSKNIYVEWDIQGDDWTAVMYKSNKLVLQGNTSILSALNINNSQDFDAHIGSDEVGKGDYFGPLVVCACYLSSQDHELVKSLGVVDSKKMSDGKMMEVGEKMAKVLKHSVRIISPEEYNEKSKSIGNVAIVLAKAHSEAISNLLPSVSDCKYIVIDQFSASKNRLLNEMREITKDYEVRQFHKGESDPAVAAASVLARYFFLLEMKRMDEKYNIHFPKGASDVITFGRNFLSSFGMDELRKVAKTSFRTTDSILGR